MASCCSPDYVDQCVFCNCSAFGFVVAMWYVCFLHFFATFGHSAVHFLCHCTNPGKSQDGAKHV